MTDIASDGRTKVWAVPAIATQLSPTVDELNAGTALEKLLTPDGLIGFEPDTADIDNSQINSLFVTSRPGRASFGNTALRLKKQSGTDNVYDAALRDTFRYIVIRRGSSASNAWTSGDPVEVYPVVFGETRNLAPESNSVQRYEIPLKIWTDPTIRATVTGGFGITPFGTGAFGQ